MNARIEMLDAVRRDLFDIENGLARNVFSNEYVGSLAEAEGYLIDDYVEGFEMLRDALLNLEECAVLLSSPVDAEERN